MEEFWEEDMAQYKQYRLQVEKGDLLGRYNRYGTTMVEEKLIYSNSTTMAEREELGEENGKKQENSETVKKGE